MSTYLNMRDMYDDIPADLLPAFDEARANHDQAVADAVDDLADIFRRLGTSHDVAETLGCGETEALVRLLHVAGHDAEADDWLNQHVVSDTDMTPEDIRDAHGIDLDLNRCPDCLDHPGWAHDDKPLPARDGSDYCLTCHGSGIKF